LSAGCWPGGEESVNADDGPLNRASIAAPATAAIAPLDPMRKTMFILLIIPAAPLMMLSASRDHLTPHAPELFPTGFNHASRRFADIMRAAQPPVV
jgi:hypothetical protein